MTEARPVRHPVGLATTQGRAVTDALQGPDPRPPPAAPPRRRRQPDPLGAAPAPADRQRCRQKFISLDCTNEGSRVAGRRRRQARRPDRRLWQELRWPVGEVPARPGRGRRQGRRRRQGHDRPADRQWIVDDGVHRRRLQEVPDDHEQALAAAAPQNQFAIVLDGEVVSAPSVRQTLSANAQISGSFTQQSAQDLGNILSYGALPLSFETSVQTVTAALGGEQLQAGLIAGAIGLALVIIYLVAYYRGLSLIAILSLIVSAILTYTIMALLGPGIGFALNLPAVCGAIVAIGITADSFIVYFERIRDEIREGRTLRPAVERAWPRARRTILVSDFVSFLAAAVLFIVTVGKVQGFAFTLGLTTLLDVVVVFLFTKPRHDAARPQEVLRDGHPWSGLDPKRLGAKPPLRRSRRASAPIDPKEA